MPIKYRDEYTGFIVDCYSHDPAGKRFYNSAFFSRPKGTHKSGLAAALVFFEALGPARFAGWAKSGETSEFSAARTPTSPASRWASRSMMRTHFFGRGRQSMWREPVRGHLAAQTARKARR